MGDVANVLAGSDGLAYVGPTTADAPTSTTSTLDADFKDLGIVSTEGLVEALSATFTEVKSWSGATVRKIRSAFDPTFKLTFDETKRETVLLYYGGADVAATIGGGSVVKVKPFTSDLRSMVFDILDGDRVTRYYLPRCEVSERADRSHTSGDASGFGVTVTAYPDPDGYTHHIFYDEDFSAS